MASGGKRKGAGRKPCSDKKLNIFSVSKRSELLFAFFMWFRENGEKYMNESIEKMIQIYLKGKL